MISELRTIGVRTHLQRGALLALTRRTQETENVPGDFSNLIRFLYPSISTPSAGMLRTTSLEERGPTEAWLRRKAGTD
jgi:hypothetical protein